MKAIVIPFLLLSHSLFAQRPVIRSVVNAVSQDARFSPGMPAELRYISAAAFRPDADIVRVGGRVVRVFDEEDGATVTITLPADLPLGPTDVVFENAEGSSQPYRIVIDAYSPGIYPPGPSPFFSVFFGLPAYGCNHTAKTGDILYLFAIGLGAPDASGAVAMPVLTVGGAKVEINEFVADGQNYRLRFVVPPGEGMHAIAVTAGGRESNVVSLPVARAILNLTPSFRPRVAAAPGAIGIAYQCNTETFVRSPNIVFGSTPDLPTSLAGVSVAVRDSVGVERFAPLYGVAASQVSYVLPLGTASGTATLSVLADGRVIGQSDLEVAPVAPDLLASPVIQVVRLRNGVQSTDQVALIDLGPDTDQVYLALYGTGFRFRSSLANVSAVIDGIDVPVEYAGAQGDTPGLDQLNLRLPRSLAGRGPVTLEFTVDGRIARTQLVFK